MPLLQHGVCRNVFVADDALLSACQKCALYDTLQCTKYRQDLFSRVSGEIIVFKKYIYRKKSVLSS